MSIRPSYGRRSVLQVLSDGMSQRPPTGKSCCEDAAQSAAEVDRLTRERDEWKDRAEMADEDRTDVLRENDKLQAKLDDLTMTVKELSPAEQHPTLDWGAVKKIVVRESHGSMTDRMDDALTDAIMALAPAVPSWLGDVPDPDDIEVERGPHGDFYVDDDWIAHANSTVHGLRKLMAEVGESCARYEAVARFIEAEEAKRSAEDERTEEQAKALAEAVFRYGGPWDNVAESARERCRAAIRAGWTKEDK